MFDGKTFATEVATRTKAFVERQLGPLRAEVDALKKELAEVRAALPKSTDIDFMVEKAIDDRFAEAIATIPKAEDIAALVPVPKDGRDGVDGKEGPAGRDGADGLAGEDGEPGLDGKSGIGLAGVLKDHEGCLVFTLSDGTIAKVGHVDGKDGAPGKDGANGRDADPEAMQAAVVAEVQKQALAPLATAYKGVWSPGTYRAGDAVTCAGSLFIAASDTDTKPETGDAWKLAVKRGRDGRDGELKAPAERKPVKL